MAGERVMWKIWHPINACAWVFPNYQQAQMAMWSFGISNWRCSQITVKEADDEQ